MARNKEKNTKNGSKILKVILIVFILGVVVVGLLLYGPFSGFRDWLITVSETSMTHQWIAELLYSDATIEKVMANNRVEEIILNELVYA